MVNDLTIDFNLRAGDTIHDGSAFSADDVTYTNNFVRQDDQNSRHTKAADWLKSVEKTGNLSVRYHLKEPYANLYHDMYRVKIRQNGILGTEGNYDSNFHATVLNGLGPCKVISFDPGAEVVCNTTTGILTAVKT